MYEYPIITFQYYIRFFEIAISSTKARGKNLCGSEEHGGGGKYPSGPKQRPDSRERQDGSKWKSEKPRRRGTEGSSTQKRG